MEPFQFLFLMFLALYMAVKLQTGDMCMLNGRKFTTIMVAFVLLILHLVKLGGPILLSDIRINDHQENTNLEAVDEICMNQDTTSMCQSAEWGIRSMQLSFPQVKDNFVYEEKVERRIMLKNFTLKFTGKYDGD